MVSNRVDNDPSSRLWALRAGVPSADSGGYGARAQQWLVTRGITADTASRRSCAYPSAIGDSSPARQNNWNPEVRAAQAGDDQRQGAVLRRSLHIRRG